MFTNSYMDRHLYKVNNNYLIKKLYYCNLVLSFYKFDAFIRVGTPISIQKSKQNIMQILQIGVLI